jgi:hypothetical protein
MPTIETNTTVLSQFRAAALRAGMIVSASDNLSAHEEIQGCYIEFNVIGDHIHITSRTAGLHVETTSVPFHWLTDAALATSVNHAHESARRAIWLARCVAANDMELAILIGGAGAHSDTATTAKFAEPHARDARIAQAILDYRFSH